MSAEVVPASTRPELIVPRTVLLAFSLELYLKCIITLEGKEYIGIHHLEKLFSELEGDTQTVIKACYNQRNGNAAAAALEYKKLGISVSHDFESALSLSSNAFQKFRYAFEKPSEMFGWMADDILQCVRATILARNPDWANFKYGLT